MAGRVTAFQRKYEEAAGKRATQAAAPVNAEADAVWAKFTEDYPDIAKAMTAKFDKASGADPTVAELAEYVQAQKRENFLTEAFDAVESVHPGWRTKAVSQEFKDWVQTSPTNVKLAASDDVADAVALFDLYEGYTLKHAPKTPVVDITKAAEAAKLAARRGAQIEGGRAAKTNAASPNQAVDLADEDQQFAAYAKQANARMAARNK